MGASCTLKPTIIKDGKEIESPLYKNLYEYTQDTELSKAVYTMTKAEGIEISPAKTNFSYSGQKLTFKLYFPSIPKDTKTFDLVENSDSEWRWYGIKLR